MKLRRKITVALAVLFLLFVGFLCVTGISVVRGLKLTVVDVNGLPLSNVFVVYEYHGDSFGFGHPGSHTKPGAILVSDKSGQLKIPPRIFFHRPLLDYAEDLRIYAIWSPQTHSNGHIWYNLDKRENFENLYEFIPEEKRLILHNITTNHFWWYMTVDEMQSLTRDLESPMLNVQAPAEVKERLRLAVENDAKHFKSLHYTNIYQNPKAPSDGRNGITYGRLMEHGIF